MSKPTYTIAVTGLNNIDSPGSGIPVIRGLKESEAFDVRIIGLSYENLEPGIYMHSLVDKSYNIPYPTEGKDVLLARLDYIHARENIDVLIPNFDAELFNFIKLVDKLEDIGVKTFLPSLEQFDARLKGKLNEFGDKYNINVPKSLMTFNLEEFKTTCDQFEYPLVVKGKYYEASIAYSYEQAVTYFNKISAKWGTPIIVQEFIQGEEFNVTGLGDGKGQLTGAVAMRKTYITDQGKAWAGITIDDTDLIKMTSDLMKNTNWQGPLEVELIKDKKDKIYLIEINPRTPAWIYLAVGAGQNHPEALVQLAMGEVVEKMEKYEFGKMFIRYSMDMICDLKEFEQIATMGEL